jgi:hypothetical protein
MGNDKRSRLYKGSPRKLSLNDDREDAHWQVERGPRWGNSRKARSKAKRYLRKKRLRSIKSDTSY